MSKITRSKSAGGVAQVIECLPGKCETPKLIKRKEGREGGREGWKERKNERKKERKKERIFKNACDFIFTWRQWEPRL
jgi:hypothetical protein